MSIGTLLCPSDTRPSRDGPGPVQYRFNVGSSTPVGAARLGLPPGPFVPLRPTTPSDVPDGLSRTAGLAERTRGSLRPRGFDRRRDFWYAGVAGPDELQADEVIVEVCGSLVADPPDAWTRFGESWAGNGPVNVQYNHVATPNHRLADCALSPREASPDSMQFAALTARSWHPGGVNVLLLDGSVRFVADGISTPIWRALGTARGGEPADLP